MKKQIKLILTGILLTSLSVKLFSQSTINGPGAFGHNPPLPLPAVYYSGWDGVTTIPFNIEHRGTQDINFLTGGIQRMKINGVATGTNQGFVGIGGVANNKLDVFGGDIDVNGGRRSYMIADQSVLWHKGGNTNIFVGVGAGQNHFPASSVFNTLIGSNAGFNVNDLSKGIILTV